MNEWTKKSVEYAKNKDYLDQLFKVYTISKNPRRPLSDEKRKRIKDAIENKKYKELILACIDYEVFPIKDSYVGFLRKDKTSIDRNPETVNRIAGALIEMGYEENDESMVREIRSEIQEFEKSFEELRIQTLLSGEYDSCNAIMTLHAGAGGTESCDWAGMLYRMYNRWAERKGLSIKVLDYLDGDITGIKTVTFEVSGENAYGYLKSEKGVHRLVRISPFNSAGKRQTSFASCDVVPDIEDEIDIELADEELKIDTYRASGAGGQHVNKTSSAIRITHLPTGIVVQCQNERSQHFNKEKAMQMLKVKLQLMKEQEQAERVSDIRGEVKEIGFGNQIRSYVMQPYTMVKDHRTSLENSNVTAVLDGNIDMFINAYLKGQINS